MGKGTRFEEFFWGPILKIKIFNAFLFIFLIGRGPRAPDDAGMHSYSFLIPGTPIILLIRCLHFLFWRGGGGPPQIKQVLGLMLKTPPPRMYILRPVFHIRAVFIVRSILKLWYKETSSDQERPGRPFHRPREESYSNKPKQANSRNPWLAP